MVAGNRNSQITGLNAPFAGTVRINCAKQDGIRPIPSRSSGSGHIMSKNDHSDSASGNIHHRTHTRRHLARLLAGETPIFWQLQPGVWKETVQPTPRGILSGSFNPLHPGHVELRRVAESILQGPVAYELPLVNAEKPPLELDEAVRRVEQRFDAPLAVSTAPVFLQKARLMPGVAFVVGADTAARVIDPRFYSHSPGGLPEALAEFRKRNCRFLVAARHHQGTLLTADNIGLPADSADLFQAVPEEVFRLDVSSSQLRIR